MADLFTAVDSPYAAVYKSLRDVREAFYRDGRIGDSNAKLDETVKLLAVHYAHRRNLIPTKEYERAITREGFSVNTLNNLVRRVAILPVFSNGGTGSIFGTNPASAFEDGDEAVAYELFRATALAFSAHGSGQNFDALNEAFGHHVRDNFRGHIEDAQYMTPPEVVDFMVRLASIQLLRQKRIFQAGRFVMIDPTCGVGSFLTAWRKEYTSLPKKHKLPPLIAIGQDKVERMVRLTGVNLVFAANTKDRVYSGNSLMDGSPIEAFNGCVDLIITNPPFGAKFDIAEVCRRGAKSTPFFAKAAIATKSIDSELLFLDRYLSLLRPGGLCLAIVPDGVVSAKGMPALARQALCRAAELRAIVELPPVTFSQAGTRTKTAIIVFEKVSSPQSSQKVFFGEATTLGYEVSKRKGVPIKRSEGKNQLPEILEAFRRRHDVVKDSDGQPLLAVWRQISPNTLDAWTPRRFQLDDKATVSRPSTIKLADLVEQGPRPRPEPYSKGKYFISVLHVIGEGLLDIPGLKSYEPITPGLPVAPGSVIISRINPRIPRVLVVPNLGRPLLCSTEFEILKPKKGMSPYALAFLLLSAPIQQQIQTLTAGTSASHSRVKPERLYEIELPVSKRPSPKFRETIKQYAAALQTIMASVVQLSELREV